MNMTTSAYFLDLDHPKEGVILTFNRDNKLGFVRIHNRDNWTLNEADVVCRSAGFYASLLAFRVKRDTYRFNWQIAISHVSCTGSEQYLAQCDHETVSSDGGYDYPTFGSALCASSGDEVNSPAILLFDFDQNRNFEGLGWILMKTVERNWSVICDDDFSMNEANAACRQLGYLGARDLLKGYGPHVYENFPDTHFVKVNCSGGNENHLQQCQWEVIGDKCQSQSLAGISCSSE